MSWLRKIFKQTKFPEGIKYPIEEAFTVGGRTFYKFKSTYNIPYERALKTVLIYEEARMKVTYEFLQQYVEATDKVLLSTKSINVFEIKKLNDILKEKLNLAFDTDILYKLASIVYFDEKEDPRVYDASYNAEKIRFWKANKDIKDFFLQEPVKNLMPYLSEVGDNLKTYSEIIQTLNRRHSECVLSIISAN